MKFDVFTYSDRGPRAANEDRVSCWSINERNLVVAVADGLGGMGGGEEAAEIAIDTIRQELSSPPIHPDQLRLAALKAHDRIRVEQTRDKALSHMATTLSAGVLSGGRLLAVHAGDTRISVARADGIKRLTTDHSEGERLFRAGKLSRDEFNDYPRRHILDSALGVHKTPTIEIIDFETQVGDVIIFTTDGVHGLIMLREMRLIAQRCSSAEELIGSAVSVVNDRGPTDNFSIAAVFLS